MFVTGLGTASPPGCFTQVECWEAISASEKFSQLSPRSHAILRKVLHSDNGIATRTLALNSLSDAFDLTPNALHGRFINAAPALAAQAATRAMENAGLTNTDIDAVIISTCTGYLCPGLTSYVSERLSLRPDVLAFDLVGQGCGAAVPNWRVAEGMLRGNCQHVLSICVEVCSAAFYLDDDPGVLISACLFGDGAGAAILSRKPGPRRIEWKYSTSLLNPADRDYLRFEQRDGMLRNILARQVPGIAAKHAENLFSQTQAETKCRREDIAAWILHPGGREVLNALRDRLGLAPQNLEWSASILREFGNLSSASLYFILERALKNGAPAGQWWLCTFGAGFSCHAGLLEVDA